MAGDPHPRIPMNNKERAFLNFLRRLEPGDGAGYPLDGPADRQTAKDVARLIEVGVIERIQETGMTETGEEADAAVYRLTMDYIASLGGPPNPQLN
jgi:hypothetical protein